MAQIVEKMSENQISGGQDRELLEIRNSDSVAESADAIATTKEEEWVTKKKVELTTTRQIETRVKRQVVLEDGRIVEDSGPMVTTNTTEDTEKQEHSQTEHRTLGDDSGSEKWIPVTNNTTSHVKEIQEKTVKSREEKEERTETENIQHLGDISDESYMTAIKSGSSDVRETLLEFSNRRDMVEAVPKVIHQSTKSRKCIDTEDKTERSQVEPGGKVINEKRTINLHEELGDCNVTDDDDDDDDDNDDYSTNKADFRDVVVKENSQKYRKTKEQELTEYVKNGKKVGEKLHYQAETSEGEKRGDDINTDDEKHIASSLKRIKLRSQNTRFHPGVNGGEWNKPGDNETKKSFNNLDQEEATRKEETSKWLEFHFGSESTKSEKGSSEDLGDIVPSTQNSFINVTMKSQPLNKASPKTKYLGNSEDDEVSVTSNHLIGDRAHSIKPKDNYFKGINHWTERGRGDNERRPNSTSPHSDQLPYVNTASVLNTRPLKSQWQGPGRHAFNRTRSPLAQNDGVRSAGIEEKFENQFRSIGEKQFHQSVPESNKIHYRLPNSEGPHSPTVKGRERITNDCDEYEYEFEGRQIIEESQNVSESKPESENLMVSSPDQEEISVASRYPSSSKKLYQRTRFAADIPPPPQLMQPPVKQKSKFGESFRKFVGKLRSSSSERKNKKRSRGTESRSPSPKENTYQKYNSLDNYGSLVSGEEPVPPPRVRHRHLHSQRPSSSFEVDRSVQRYYLGEDPFSESIYGREKEYDENFISKKMHKQIKGATAVEPDEENYKSRTLGRFSKSTGRLFRSEDLKDDFSQDRGGIQTLPRKLLGEQNINKNVLNHKASNYSENRRKGVDGKQQMSPHTRSLINVSFVNQPYSLPGPTNENRTPPWQEGPAKPARTYRSNLLRSQSFNVHPGQKNVLDSYRSQPYLGGVEESPLPLESPSMIYRWSQHSSNTNDDQKSTISDIQGNRQLFSRKMLNKSLDRHLASSVNSENGRQSSNYSQNFNSWSAAAAAANANDASSTNDGVQSDRFRLGQVKKCSPTVYTRTFRDGNKVKTISRRENSESDDYSETIRIESKTDDLFNPAETNTVRIFSKRKIPSKNGHGLETIESTETKTVIKHHGPRIVTSEQQTRPLYDSPPTGVVIKVRNNT